MSRRVITIGRQFGSNGRDIAMKLAKRLGINCYDKELIEIAAKEKNLSYEELKKVDEKRANPWRYPVENELQMAKQYRFEPLNDILFYTEVEVIKQLAEKEDCIIVGRCANEILSDNDAVRRVFIHAPIDYRIRTVMDRASIDEKEAALLIKKVDKQRKYYYNYFTDKRWEDMSQYDLTINSGTMSKEAILNVLTSLYESIL